MLFKTEIKDAYLHVYDKKYRLDDFSMRFLYKNKPYCRFRHYDDIYKKRHYCEIEWTKRKFCLKVCRCYRTILFSIDIFNKLKHPYLKTGTCRCNLEVQFTNEGWIKMLRKIITNKD